MTTLTFMDYELENIEKGCEPMVNRDGDCICMFCDCETCQYFYDYNEREHEIDEDFEIFMLRVNESLM